MDNEMKGFGENMEIEVAPVSSDIRIGSVVELEDHESYEVNSVFEENSYGNKITLEMIRSTRKASMKLSYGQVVNCYGAIKRVCAVHLTGWSYPRVSLKPAGGDA